MKLVESRFVNISVVDLPAYEDLFIWSQTGSGNPNPDGMDFTIPSTASEGDQALMFFYYRNSNLTDLQYISGINVYNYPYPFENSLLHSVGGVLSVLVLGAGLMGITADNVGSTYNSAYTDILSPGQSWSGASEYGYAILGINKNYFINHDGNTGLTTTTSNITIPNTSYSRNPALRITVTVGFSSAFGDSNILTESKMSMNYDYLYGEDSGQTISNSNEFAIASNVLYLPKIWL